MHEAVTSLAGGADGRDHGRPSGSYAWGSSPAEQRRLEQQLAVLRPHSTTLLDHVGVRPGWSTIDLGCGPGGILDLLSARVGPGGHVMGVDLDSGHAASARGFARDRSLANVEVVTADARHTGLPGAAFDLVHTRLVLVNISRPGDVVAEMARLAKPGGWVAALDAAARRHLADPDTLIVPVTYFLAWARKPV